MARKKKQSGPQKTPTFSDGEHYNAIMIEDLKSEFKFVIEGLQDLRSEIHSRFDAAKSENNSRFDLIELTLKYHSTKFERVDQRFDRLEFKMDRVAAKVDSHDVDIAQLKTVS